MNTTTIQEEVLLSKPTYTARNLKTTIFNEKGIPYKTLFTKNLEHYKFIDLTDLSNITFSYTIETDEDSKSKNSSIPRETWTIVSDYGVLDGNDRLTLRSNVKATTDKKDSIINTIESDYLEIDFGVSEVRTPSKVYLKGNQLYNYGYNLKGNFKTNNYSLLKGCHAKYEIKNN
jgi:LPS export ABC transporter protein LptC